MKPFVSDIQTKNKKKKMKMKKHIQTQFYNFIMENYENLTDEETNINDDEIIDDINKEGKKAKIIINLKDDEIEDENDDFNVDEMIEDFKKLEKKIYTTKKEYGSIYNKRK
jgi:hypothetical protein